VTRTTLPVRDCTDSMVAETSLPPAQESTLPRTPERRNAKRVYYEAVY
jgi:hypothetical protein